MEELSVVALSGRVLRQVFGASDEHLRKIRKALGVRVSLDEERGKIIVRSESQENARRCAYLLEKLQRWVDRDGAPLLPTTSGALLTRWFAGSRSPRRFRSKFTGVRRSARRRRVRRNIAKLSGRGRFSSARVQRARVRRILRRRARSKRSARANRDA